MINFKTVSHILVGAAISGNCFGMEESSIVGEANEQIQNNYIETAQIHQSDEVQFLDAVTSGQLEVVKFLYQKNKDLLKVTQKDGYNALHLAAGGGHLEVVEFLCEQNSDLLKEVTEDGYNYNTLHLAAINGHLEVVKYLCQKNSELIKAVNKQGWNALHLAATSGHLEVVKFLCQQNSDLLKEVTKYGYNALNMAAQTGHFEVVKFLCQEYSYLLKEVTEEGMNALHLAAGQGQLEVVKFLCQEYSYLLKEVSKKHTYNSLHYAASRGHLEVVKFLCQEHSYLLKEVGSEGYNALHCAAVEGHFEVVAFLHDQNNELLRGTTKQGQNAMHLAAEFGHIKVVKFLYGKRKSLLYETSSALGQNVFHAAVYNGHLDIVEFLYNQDKRLLNSKANGNENVLLLATAKGHIKVFEFLYKKNAALLIQENAEGLNALFAAGKFGQLEIIKYLYKQDKSILRKTGNNNVDVFHTSAYFGKIEIVKFLLEKYPDLIKKKAKSKRNVLHTSALNKESIEVVKLLIEICPELLNEKDSSGKLPFNYALEYNCLDIAKLMISERLKLAEKLKEIKTRQEKNEPSKETHQSVKISLGNEQIVNSKAKNTPKLAHSDLHNGRDVTLTSKVTPAKEEKLFELKEPQKSFKEDAKLDSCDNQNSFFTLKSYSDDNIKEAKKVRFKISKPSTWRDTRDEKKKVREEKKEKKTKKIVLTGAETTIGAESSCVSTSCADSDDKSHISVSISESEMSESCQETGDKNLTPDQQYKCDLMREFYPKLYSFINKSNVQNISQLCFKNNHLIKNILFQMLESNIIEITKFNITKNGAKINANLIGYGNVKLTVHATHGSGAYDKWYENPDIVVSFFEFIAKSDSIIHDFLKIHFGEYCFSRDLTAPINTNNNSPSRNDSCGNESKAEG